MIQIGQIYRDTYFDKDRPNLANRTVRVIEIEGNKARVETVTDCYGKPAEKPRKTRVSFGTLARGYVLVEG